MSDEFINKVVDKYEEHIHHVKNEADCSTCFKENRLLKAHKVVNFNRRPEDSGYGWREQAGFDNYYGGQY